MGAKATIVTCMLGLRLAWKVLARVALVDKGGDVIFKARPIIMVVCCACINNNLSDARV